MHGGALAMLDTSGRAADESVLDAVRHALDANFGRVSDLFRDLDVNGDNMVSKAEFRKALPLLGVPHAGDAECDKLFDEVDVDGSGRIDYREVRLSVAECGWCTSQRCSPVIWFASLLWSS